MTSPVKRRRLGLAVGVGACAIAAGVLLLLAVSGSASRVPLSGVAGPPVREVGPARDVGSDGSGAEPRLAPRPKRAVILGASRLSELTARMDQLETAQDDLWTELVTQDTASHDAEPVAEAEYAEAIASGMAARLETERADPAWAPEAERILSEVVAARALAGSSLVAVDCRATLCQLEVRHDGELARDSYTARVLPALPFDTEMFYRHVEDDSGSRTISYIARSGHLLPRAPASPR